MILCLSLIYGHIATVKKVLLINYDPTSFISTTTYIKNQMNNFTTLVLEHVNVCVRVHCGVSVPVRDGALGAGSGADRNRHPQHHREPTHHQWRRSMQDVRRAQEAAGKIFRSGQLLKSALCIYACALVSRLSAKIEYENSFLKKVILPPTTVMF